MRFHGESRQDRYDAIVIGSGIGGLTAAALLARAGREVLVVERHDRVGGYAHSFRRGRYAFDSSVHLVGGCEPTVYEGGGLIHQLLRELGVRDRVDFKRVDPCYAAVYPECELRVPSDLDEFIRVHTDAFPEEAKGFNRLVHECLNIRIETRRAAELASPTDVVRTPDRFPTLLRYRRATLAAVLDDHLDSPQLKAMFATLWPYIGLPPSRVSFLYFATMLMTFVADGAYYCRGSFQRFADALADAVKENGSEVLLRSPVRRIIVESGIAGGVVLENGQRITADLVVSNADATQTVQDLVGPHEFPKSYLDRFARMKPSVSAVVAYIASDLPLDGSGLAHETFLFPSWDHDEAFATSAADAPTWASMTVPTLADPGLAPAGEHLMVVTSLVRHDSLHWREAKDAVARGLIQIAERHLPGLEQSIRFLEVGTPRTMERYTRNTDGAIYGWEVSPAQVGRGRLGMKTPIERLYLVGHWTHPGGGVNGVVWSGVQAARTILGYEHESQLWEAMGRAAH